MNPDPIHHLKNDLQRLKMHANRLRGQNFLIDPLVRKNLIDSLDLASSDFVIEIGPGTGILTHVLVALNIRLICIELDSNLLSLLKTRFGKQEHVTIVHDDFVRWARENFETFPLHSVKIISNLPYSISSPVLLELARYSSRIITVAMTVQKEVAERVTAIPGHSERSLLSVAVQSHLNVQIVESIPPESYFPQPAVDSSALRIIPHFTDFDLNWDEWIEFLKRCFAKKRKTIYNNLRYGYPDFDINKILDQVDINPQNRFEQLPLTDFVKLFKLLQPRT